MARINAYGRISIPNDDDVFILDSTTGTSGTRTITWGALKQLLALSTHKHPGSDITSPVTAADTASRDSSGNVISSTYFNTVTVNGTRVTFYRPNGTSLSIDTQDTNTQYLPATSTSNGLLTASDKQVIDSIPSRAIADVAIADHLLAFKLWDGSTKKTIYLPDTTYSKATQSSDGLMAKEDKKRLDDLSASQQSVVAITNDEIDSMFK